MEENNTSPSQETREPQNTPILDVQPPTPASTPVRSDVPSASNPSVVAPPPDEEQTSSSSTTETSTLDSVKQPVATVPHKHYAPIVPIIVALIIAAILAVITVLSFQNTNAPEPAKNTQTPTQAEAAVTPESIDDTSAEIDQALGGVDESSDFPEDALSDQTLGL